MSAGLFTLLSASALLAIGAFCLLPHRHVLAKGWLVHAAGALLSSLGVVLFASQWTAPFPNPAGSAWLSQWLTQVFFYGLGTITLSGAVMTVVSRNPVHNALWFAVVLLSTSGLFLLVDAQFLAAGTVIVYAGAIVVTFLFVLMLAQSEGYALYDRLARSPRTSSITLFILLATLSYAISIAREAPDLNLARQRMRSEKPLDAVVASESTGFDERLPRVSDLAALATRSNDTAALSVINRWNSRSSTVAADGALAPTSLDTPHVAGLGQALFTDHLIAVEVGGALLFVALVGAAAIAAPRIRE
jgi:NADH-quinone oxidoreductase subunit J